MGLPAAMNEVMRLWGHLRIFRRVAAGIVRGNTHEEDIRRSRSDGRARAERWRDHRSLGITLEPFVSVRARAGILQQVPRHQHLVAGRNP
jgi:hypothetical protein